MNEAVVGESSIGLTKDINYYRDLAHTLRGMNQQINSGRGYNHIETLILFLEQGDIESAKTCCFNESDKYGNPDIKGLQELIKTTLFEEGEKNPWDFTWTDEEI